MEIPSHQAVGTLVTPKRWSNEGLDPMKLALDNRRSDKETWNLETLMLHANFQPKQVNHEISLEEAYKGGEKDGACVSFSRCTAGGTGFNGLLPQQTNGGCCEPKGSIFDEDGVPT